MAEPRARAFLNHSDIELIQARAQLSPGERLIAMLDAREWVFAAARARVRRQHPEMSPDEVNLFILEDIERAKRREARS